MSSEPQRVQSVFLAVVERPANDRTALLDRECGGDNELRRRVEALLKAHDDPGSFIDAIHGGVETAQGWLASEKLGTIIGQYKLLEKIGEGGFGVVYMAEQARPLARKVALKIIKPGMDTRQVIARFEAERQALALMDHPNIAKVHDAGTTENGRPYFVMELVRGVPITAFCDGQKLTSRQRLTLFVDVCSAVQHAHQKGIIHRDLKPSNVMVTMHDDKAIAKVIDFGVSKAMSQQLTEATLFTGYGQMIGTPAYMSPEQAQLSGLDIDTRSDVYSLGVLLYELVTGTTPFDEATLKRAGFDEMRRMIREVEPPRPSERVSTLKNGLLTTAADQRQVDPRKLSQSLHGELDWIVMKALEKDRNRRYETPNSLARDIERYLHDESVQACKPSAAYRLRKFARRNRAVGISAGLIAAALVVGTVVSISQAIRATRAESLAKARLKEATEARAGAEVSAQKARRAVDDMYTQVAERWLANQPQMEPLQREFLDKALQFYSEYAQETSSDPTVRFETARAYRRIGEIQHRLGQPGPAEDAFRHAADRLQTLVDELPATPAYRAELAAALHRFGVLLGDTGRYSDEEKLHRRALTLEEQLAADHPTKSSYRRDLGRGHWYRAQVLAALHQRDAAAQTYRKALGVQKELVARFPSVPEFREHLAESYLGLGQQLRHLGRTNEYNLALDEAAGLFEQLTVESPNMHGIRNQLANVLYWRMLGPSRSQPESYRTQDEQDLRKAVALQKKLVEDFPAVPDYRYDLFRSQKTLGWLLGGTNRPEEAEIAFREAALITEKLAADYPSVHYYFGGLAATYHSLGEFRAKSGRLSEAEDAFRKSIAAFDRLVTQFPNVPEYGPDRRQTYFHLASLLNSTRRSKEAADVYRSALEVDVQDPLELDDLAWLLVIYPDAQLRDPKQALRLAKKAVELAPQTARNWRTLGVAQYQAGNWNEAVAALEKSIDLARGAIGYQLFHLAMAHEQLGNKEQARNWNTQAVEWMEMNRPDGEGLLRVRSEASELFGISDEQSSTDSRHLKADPSNTNDAGRLTTD